MEPDVAELPLSEKIWLWLDANRTRAVYGAVILLLGGIIAGYVFWQQNEKEIAAGEALSDVSVPQLGSAAPRPDAAEAFLKVAADYPKFSAGVRAKLLAGTSFFLAGKYPEAKAEFEKFARDHRDSGLLGQALLGIAACLDAQGKTDEAAAAYKNLADHHSGENTVPQARFALAGIYEKQAKPDLARALYEEIVRNDPYGTSIGNESAMRLEELRIKYPNLTPAPPTAGSPAMPSLPMPAPRPAATSPSNAAPASKSAPANPPTTNAAASKLKSP